MLTTSALAAITMAMIGSPTQLTADSASRLTLSVGTSIQDSTTTPALPEAEIQDDAAVTGLGQQTSLIPGTRLTVTPGFAYLFNSSIDGGGSFSLGRFRIRGRGATQISDTVDLTYGVRYQWDSFDFTRGDSDSFFGKSPWKDVNTLQLDLAALWSIGENWRVFGGGVVRFGAESGADWAEGIEAGGAIGVSYTVSPSLTVGGGVGVTTRLEDSLYFYPIVVADWLITDGLILTTRISTGWGDEAGVELVYTITPGWDVGVGAAYEWNRFRLDDEGPAPGGVGVIRSLPTYGFLRWNATPKISFSVFAGINAWGQLEALDKNGNKVADESFRPGFLLGIQGQFTF